MGSKKNDKDPINLLPVVGILILNRSFIIDISNLKSLRDIFC